MNATRSRVNEPEAPAEDYVKTIVELNGRLVALSGAGKLFERVPDGRDFATGPNHTSGYNWRPIKGPFDEA